MGKFRELNRLAMPITVYILSIVILFMCRHEGMTYSMKTGWIYPVLPALAVWCVVRWTKRFSVIPMTLVFIFIFGEIFTLLFNHTPYSVCVVNLIAETDANESSGFLRSSLMTPDFYAALGIMVVAYIAALGVAYGISLLGKKPQRICGYAVMILALVSAGLLTKSYITLHYRFHDPDLSYFIQHRDDPPEYYTTVTRFLGGASYVYSSSSSEDIILEKLKAAQVDQCTFDSPLIIMVLGESYNKHHTPIYEPEYRNTTPCMTALRDSGKLVVYEDVVSPYNHTNTVLPTLFSTCSFEERARWRDYTLFPAIFKKAGYNVTFLSNQFAIQADDVWNQFSGGIFNKRRLSEPQYDYHNSKTYKFDEELLSELPDVNAMRNDRNLIIVQFMGQHVNYSDRFPDEFAKYNSDNTTSRFGGKTESQRLADYDNSVFYNDYVIGQLIERIASLDAIVIYFADHGEECYDYRNEFMRTDEPEMTAERAKYQFEVPFVVYMTEKYEKNHPQLAEKVRNARERAMLNTDITNMLFHLAGLKTPGYEARRDVLSEDYEEGLPRMLNDMADYNLLGLAKSKSGVKGK